MNRTICMHYAKRLALGLAALALADAGRKEIDSILREGLIHRGLEILEGVGHFPHVEEPQRLFEMIARVEELADRARAIGIQDIVYARRDIGHCRFLSMLPCRYRR